jgi:hypothetical protein
MTSSIGCGSKFLLVAQYIGTLGMSDQNQIARSRIDTTQVACIKPTVIVNGLGGQFQNCIISLRDLEAASKRSNRTVALLSGLTTRTSVFKQGFATASCRHRNAI